MKTEITGSNSLPIQSKLELYDHFRHELKKYRKDVLWYRFKNWVKNNLYKIVISKILLAALIVSIYYFYDWAINNFMRKINKPVESSVIIYDANKTHEQFLNDLAMYESSGKYDVVKGEYWGRYQFGSIAREEILGQNTKITKEEFLSNHNLQDGLVTELLQINKRYLKEYIGKYEGKTVAGIYITQSSLLAGSHLGGFSNVEKFLDSDGKEDFTDGNGTHISKYMKHFSGYRLSL